MSVVRTFRRMAIPWSTILQLGKSDFQNSWSSVCPETPLSDRNMNWNSWRNLFLFYAIQTPSGQFEWISSTGNTGTCWVVPSLHHRRDLPACVASFYRRICERESGMLLGRKNCLLPDGPCPPPPNLLRHVKWVKLSDQKFIRHLVCDPSASPELQVLQALKIKIWTLTSITHLSVIQRLESVLLATFKLVPTLQCSSVLPTSNRWCFFFIVFEISLASVTCQVGNALVGWAQRIRRMFRLSFKVNEQQAGSSSSSSSSDSTAAHGINFYLDV